MKKYNKYIYIKDNFKATFKGYRLSELLSFQFACYSYGMLHFPSITFKKIIKNFFNVKTLGELEEVFCHNGFIFSHADLTRNDYIELVDKSSAFLKGSKTFRYKKQRNNNYNLYLIIKSIYQAFKYLGNDFTVKEKLYWVQCIVETKLNIKYVESVVKKSKIKGFVAFNSSINQDSILCLVCNKYKIPSYSLQHGFYLYYEKNIPIDVINYENITANKLLCWGKSTIENILMFGVSKEKLLIVGNPRMTNLENVELKKTDFKKVIVLMGRYIHHDSNLELLKLLQEVASKTEIDIYLKLHPSLEQMKLDKFYNFGFKLIAANDKLSDVLPDFDFAIANNTSAYFDAKMNGLLCIRYGKDEIENFGEREYVFNNLEEYFSITRKFLELPYTVLNDNFKKSLEYHFAKDVELNFLRLNL